MNRLYCRRDFLLGGAAVVATSAAIPSFAGAQAASAPVRRSADFQSRLITKWDEASEEVSPKVYCAYLRDGDTRGYRALTANAFAFEKVMREVKATVVTGDLPAIWSVYNMGYIVKTRESLFSIDLNHRRGTEFAPLLDFALVTHNHGDHWRKDFYRAMTERGKVVISNFLDNPRFNEMKGDSEKGVGTYRIKDVEVRTSLISTTRATADAAPSRSSSRPGGVPTCGSSSPDAGSTRRGPWRKSIPSASCSAICGSWGTGRGTMGGSTSR